MNLITQEVRVSSNDAGAPVRWTAGVFFSHASQTDTESVVSPFYSINLFGLPPDTSILYSQITSRDQQIAAFAQADIKLKPDLTLTLGGRVSHNVAKYTQYQSGPIASSEFPEASGEQSETPFIPKAALAYQATDNDLYFLSASKGYRVGGANQPIPLLPTPTGCPLSSQPPPFSSDSVWSYELGTKMNKLDSRLRLEGSVYYVKWSKIQQLIYFTSCSFGFIANTGDADVKGFDASAKFALTDNFVVGLAASYTDAKITKTVVFDGTTLVQKGDSVGTLPGVNSPWNVSASAEYGFNIAGHKAFIRAEDYYRNQNPGPFNSEIPGSPLYSPTIVANPGYNILNARFGVTLSSVDVALFVNNLTDSHPALYRYSDGVDATLFTDSTLRPRTIGVTGTYKF
jgi:outer membrane receptor protein involved in Fe transport